MGANKRVSLAAQGILPAGFERVTAVLPEYQAYIVNKWAEDAQKMNQGKAVRMKAPVLSGAISQGTDIPRHKRGTCDNHLTSK
jgi:hypothetical protein